MPRKKFIADGEGTTFYLGHRSQRDPLANDDEAPQHVLMESKPKDKKDKNKRKEEQIKYGIYYDDNYDYLQHLRDVGDLSNVGLDDSFRVGCRGAEKLSKEPQSIVLPSSVFESGAQMKVGLLNKAVKHVGPRLTDDPEIIAALDGDFDFENPDNELEDNFMELGNAECSDESDKDGEGREYSDNEDMFGDDDDFSEEETKSRFTNYSMSSAVTKRNDGLTNLDEQFEEFYAKYDDDQIGGLHDDNLSDSAEEPENLVVTQVMEKIIAARQKMPTLKDFIEKGTPVNEKFHRETQDDGQLETMFVEKPAVRFDCESIRSTRSSLYNHPKKIENPSKNQMDVRTTKIGENTSGVATSTYLTRKPVEVEGMSSDDDDDDDNNGRTLVTFRAKDETPEERKARKQAVKEDRRMKRGEKSALKKAFKDEKMRLNKEVINLKSNLQCVQIV